MERFGEDFIAIARLFHIKKKIKCKQLLLFFSLWIIHIKLPLTLFFLNQVSCSQPIIEVYISINR